MTTYQYSIYLFQTYVPRCLSNSTIYVLHIFKNLIRCVCHKTKKEAKECDYYDEDDENKLCSEYSGTEYSYDMEEDNFDKEMPLKITKE